MLNIGLDVHLRSSALCILDSNGRVIRCESIKGHPRRVVERLARSKNPFGSAMRRRPGTAGCTTSYVLWRSGWLWRTRGSCV